MRIPPSVFVMSVVTAVPFGLAIRDTVKEKPAVSGDDLTDDDGLGFGRRGAAESEAELARYEAEMKAEAAAREARTKERIAKLDQLVGAKAAQMGPLFDGIVLGAGAGSFQPENVRQRIERASSDGFLAVDFDADATALNAVTVTVSSDYETSDACEQLASKLTTAWGHGTNNAWLDPATHQRATLTSDYTCVLRFDRYLDAASWVAQLPIDAVGTSADKLAQKLGPAAEVDEDLVAWSIPGVGFGKGATKIEAYAAKGRIIGFKVTGSADFDSTLQVRDALSAKLKAQPTKNSDSDYGDYNAYQWKKRVPVVLEQSDTDKFTVTVGKLSWD